ncbi:MAG: ubiquitin carboxyl-hydrolase [Muribaculaceae bacterium]
MKRKVIISGDFEINECVIGSEDVAANSVVIKGKKASERIGILKKAGIDTSNLFAMGDNMVVRVVDGVPTEVLDDDPVYNMIKTGGHVPDRRLFRRWVMAQMFRTLRAMKYYRLNFTECLQRNGYEYSWKMLVEEIRVQKRLHDTGDIENYNERTRFFNKNVVVAMMEQYLVDLEKHIDSLKVKHCKGVPYKTIKGTHYFIEDINCKVYYPLRKTFDMIVNEVADYDIESLYFHLVMFNNARVKLAWNTKMCKAFVDAYKGAGAFYTMKNLILFHGCKFRDRGKFVNKEISIVFLDAKSTNLKGWELLGVMKNFIEDNNVSIEDKLNEWKNR